LFGQVECNMLAIIRLPLLSETVWSLGKGWAGEILRVYAFPEEGGGSVDHPRQDQGGTISFSLADPFGHPLIEAKLESSKKELWFSGCQNG